MVKVKLAVSRIGPSGSFHPGDVIEVSADEAKRMVAKEQCEIIRTKKPERAVKRAKAEKAVK